MKLKHVYFSAKNIDTMHMRALQQLDGNAYYEKTVHAFPSFLHQNKLAF